MHIKTAQAALLSNHELLLHLQREEAEYTGTDGTSRARPKPPGLKHVLADTLNYLDPPTSPDAPDASHVAALAAVHPRRPMTLYKGPHSLFRALSPRFRLNKAEYLQIYNLRPKTILELDLVVEESSIRFDDDELHEIVAIIAAVFDQEEADIPDGVEDEEMHKIGNKLLGAAKKKKRAVRAKA